MTHHSHYYTTLLGSIVMFSDDYCSGVQICGESKKVHLPEGQNNCFSRDCFERQAVQHK